MFKLLIQALTFILVLTPFFSYSAISIFESSVPTSNPKSESTCLISGAYPGSFDSLIGSNCAINASEVCSSLWSTSPYVNGLSNTTRWENVAGDIVQINSSAFHLYCSKDVSTSYVKDGVRIWEDTGNVRLKEAAFDSVATMTRTCPSGDDPSSTFAIDVDSDGQVDKCANPSSIPLFDSCNINDVINVQVTEQNACFSKPDGSSCSVSAVDIGGGNQVYMGSEGNCYETPKPDISGNPDLADLPETPDDMCTTNTNAQGSFMVCNEDASNVCSDSGSSVDGGSVQSCQSGCGELNGQFVCFSPDTDGDGVPDYLDPDKDGDGIPNGDDLDANGDGVDDPITNGGKGDAVNVDLDLSPVVSKLNDINVNLEDLKKSLTETTTTLQKKPTQDLKGFWESEYPDGLDGLMKDKLIDIQDSEFYGFLDQFKPNIGGGAPPSFDMCFNIGSLGNFGCHNFNIDPRTFPAIKIFILVTAGFLCRRILFGG